MKLLTDLFSTDYGLMSISGIIFMLGMGVFFLRYFKRKMAEDAATAAKAASYGLAFRRQANNPD